MSSKRKKRIVIAAVVLIVLIAVSHAMAMTNDSSRIESTKTANVSKDTPKTKEAPKPPEKAPVAAATTTPEPTAPPVDPNHCEPAMWWRADNYECIPKTGVSTPAPTARVAVASGTGDCSLVNNYNWDRTVAFNVCMAESGGNPNNANWSDPHPEMGCNGSFGLFQINCGHGQVFDGPANVAIAYQMYQASGWKPWGATTCRYKVSCY